MKKMSLYKHLRVKEETHQKFQLVKAKIGLTGKNVSLQMIADTAIEELLKKVDDGKAIQFGANSEVE